MIGFNTSAVSLYYCVSHFLLFDQGSLTEFFCCLLVILCSELFVSLFFWDLVLVSSGLFSIYAFFSCLDLLSVSIFSVPCNFSFDFVKVTYLGIRSAHERVWLVERKPIWLPRAYLMRGDLEPTRGNLHVCKLLRDLTNIQIRTVTAERVGFVLSAFARRTCYNSKKEGR